jgi:Dolichyl-phosphate-mannose-protein mannosyltransferase
VADRPRRLPIAALLFGGLLLHLQGLVGRSLNTDEVYLAFAARTGGLAKAVFADVHPPLYPLLVGVLTALSVPEAGWRLLSVLFWLGAAYLTYRAGRLLLGEEPGLIAAALLIVMPLGLTASHLVRSYALAALLAAAVLYLVVRHLEDPRPGDTALLGFVAALGCFTFYYHLYLTAALGLVGLLLWWRGRVAGRNLFAAACLTGLLFSPWLLIVLGQADALGGGWITWSPAPQRVLRRFTQILAEAGGLAAIEAAIRLIVPSVAGLGATALTLLAFAYGAFRLPRHPATAFVLGAVAVTPLIALAAHYLFGAFIALHYFIVIAPAATLVVAACFARLPWRAVAGVLLGLVIAANLALLPAALGQGDEPLRPATRWLNAHLDDGDPVLALAWFVADGYRHYDGRGLVFGLPLVLRPDPSGQRVQPGIMTADETDRLRNLLEDRERVGVLLSHTAWRGVDRGEAFIRSALQETGFIPIASAGWPAAAPSVRAQVWLRAPL